MKYYIIETQIRPDGQINITTTSRQSIASALSFYYERLSKMRVTTLYTSVSVMLCDQNLNVIEHKTLETEYVEPVEE